MKIKMKRVLVAIAVAFAASSATAQVELHATVSGDGITAVGGWYSPVDPRVKNAAGGYTYDLFLDSASDILVIDATLTVCHGQVFNDTDPRHAATDHAPPIPALADAPGFGNLNADLWVTTPGGTSAADAARLDLGETVSHFDTTDEGPQSGFHWASITLIPDSESAAFQAILDATIQTAATPTPIFSEVRVAMRGLADCGVEGGCCSTVPEPDSFCLVAITLLGIGTLRRNRVHTMGCRERGEKEQGR